MLEWHDREVQPDEPTDLTRPLARSIDHDLRSNLALRGLDPPSASVALDCSHGGATEDLGTLGDGSLRERVRHAGRVDVAVAREVGGAEDALRVDKREELARPLGGDDLEGNAQHLCDALAVLELV